MIEVLVVDPGSRAANSLLEALEGQEMVPTVVDSLQGALQQLDRRPPHAVVLACSAQGEETERLCRAICERTLAPVLVLGGREEDLDVVRALAAGADAHLLEPFRQEVLIAQLWALLRRVGLVVPSCATRVQ
jgi:DNA-binding response OmpR family regulator